jgi:hypothetical protein
MHFFEKKKNMIGVLVKGVKTDAVYISLLVYFLSFHVFQHDRSVQTGVLVKGVKTDAVYISLLVYFCHSMYSNMIDQFMLGSAMSPLGVRSSS